MALYQPILLRTTNIRWISPLGASVIVGAICVPISMAAGMPIATALILTYQVGIIYYIVDRQARELRNLRPVLTCDDETFVKIRESLRRHPRYMIALSWLLAPITTFVVNINGPTIVGLRAGEPVTFGIVWGFAITILVWAFFFQIVLILARNSWTFSRLGAEQTRIDLINFTSLIPYSRVGIRTLVVFAGGYAILPIAFVGGLAYLNGVLISLAISLPIAFALLVVPMYPVRQKIRQAKEEETSRVLRAMRGDKSAIDELQIDTGAADMDVSGLVMYRQMIDEISDWPIDAPGAVRFGLYVIIPISAWFGAAMVENVVDKLM